MSRANSRVSDGLHAGASRAVHIGGLMRSYVVHAPPNCDGNSPLPVVIALHGATMNGPMMAWFTDLDTKADQAGFLAVYPNGTGKRSSLFWNGGNCCGPAMQNNVDDVAFISALIDDLARVYPIDSGRIFATGMSNGAMMAYRLAAELSERIAAIAPVAGCLATKIGHLKRSVPVLHFHGTNDEFVPFRGGKGAKSTSGITHRSVDESIQPWVKANSCQEDPVIDVLSARGEEPTVIRKTYGRGTDGAEVVLIAIEGGGHTWPGKRPSSAILGMSALNISANDLTWEFFQNHARQ